MGSLSGLTIYRIICDCYYYKFMHVVSFTLVKSCVRRGVSGLGARISAIVARTEHGAGLLHYAVSETI